MNPSYLYKQLALNYDRYLKACKPSEHCYFKGKYKAYFEIINNFYGNVSIQRFGNGNYSVETNTGYYMFHFD